jgi:hypothetical protein
MKMADRKKTSLKETIAFVFRKMPGFKALNEDQASLFI